MKKKYFVPSKEKSDWIEFTKKIYNITPKDEDIINNDTLKNKYRKLDLHGFSLIEANKEVKKFIIDSFNNRFRKILIITGKGLRSKTIENPYVSSKLSVLKYSIPEFIEKDEDLKKKINTVKTASPEDGGDGAISIFLKDIKKIKE